MGKASAAQLTHGNFGLGADLDSRLGFRSLLGKLVWAETGTEALWKSNLLLTSFASVVHAQELGTTQAPQAQ